MDVLLEMKLDLESLKSAFARSIKSGPVTHVDAEKGYRFSLGKDDEGGEMLSPWIPHPETAKSSIPLEVGQMVGVMSSNGDLRQGQLIRGGYSKDHESPNDDMAANVFQDAGVRVSIADGALVIEADGATFTFSGAGLVVSGGRVEHDGKNIGSTHTHGGIERGGADTNPPNS